jgi:hypothetical protein
VDRSTIERIFRDRIELERRALEQRASALDMLAEEVARSRMLPDAWRSLLGAARDVRRLAADLPRPGGLS